jgi:ABC-2 type transport system permease protein
MAWNLFLKELKQYRTTFIVWSLTIVGLIFATVAAAMPALLSGSASLAEYVKVFPPEFLRAFSFSLASFSDPLGFYTVYSTLYTLMLGGIFSITVTAGILHKEQAYGTAEFLNAKPLSRTAIVVTKIAAFLALDLALNLLAFLMGWFCLAAYSPAPFRFDALVVLSVYGLGLTLSMGGVGLLFSLLVKRAKSLTGPAVGIVLGFYLIDMAAKITDKYDAVGWVSPFKWVDLDVVRAGYGFQWWRIALFTGLIAMTFAAAALIYRKKDILT